MTPPSDPVVTDPGRLAALMTYDVLDTPPEAGFDDVVHLAAQACDAPVALVSLVDRDRQWFKARLGFPRDETDLDSSICRFVLAENDILQIPDLAADPRTRANPLVTGAPFIRFYAGAPLRTPGGAVLGSLCVIAQQPRPAGLTAAQADTLRRLARQVMSQLELRAALGRRDALLWEQGTILRARDAMTRTQSEIAAGGGDLDVILDKVVAGAMAAIPAADGGVLMLIEGDALHDRAVRGGPPPHGGPRVVSHDRLAGRCVLDNMPLLVADAVSDPRAGADVAAMPSLRSVALAPVSRAGKVLGVLQLQSREAGAFSTRDLETVRLFAGIATSGLVEALEMGGRRAGQASEARYRAVFESAIDYAIIVMDLDGRVTNWNVGAERVLGWSAAEMCGRPADALFTPEDRAAGIPAREMDGALTAGRGVDERWHLRRGGERFWANGEMMALRDADGLAIGFVKILRDRTDQRRATERQVALAGLGDRLRDLETIPDIIRASAGLMAGVLGATRVGYGLVDADAEIVDVPIDWCGPGIASVAGRHRFRDYGSYVEELKDGQLVAVDDVEGDPRTRDTAPALLALGIRVLLNVPVVERGRLIGIAFVHYDRAHAWIDAEREFVRSVADRTQAAVARLRAEAEQQLRNHELLHRLKNTLAVVQAIVTQTLRNAADPVAARDVLAARLVALGNAHDILMTGQGKRADLRAVIVEALRLHDDGQPGRLVVEGPAVVCGAQAALSLGLVVHELATNALKYGALSVPAGIVTVTWDVRPAAAGPELHLRWTEAGGPPVDPPTRKGFGSRLIERGLSGAVGGTMTMRYLPGGLSCVFVAPLARFEANDDVIAELPGPSRPKTT